MPDDEALVNLHLLDQMLAFGVDHGPAQLVQHRPRRLAPAEPELALQLQGRHARRRGAHQIGRPEPQMQRRMRLVQNRARGHRRLAMAGRALPHEPTLGHRPRLPLPAARARKPVRPSS